MTSEELRALYTEHHHRLYLVSLAITTDRQTAEDAVHNALLRLLTKNHRTKDPLAYVMRAVRNAAIDIVRSRTKEEPLQREFLVGDCETAHVISPRMLGKALGELRLDERETMILHIYAGMTFQEIANLRRRSINTVSAWYRRGLAKLRRIFEVENE